MIDYRSTARGLLIALRSVGFSEDADALEENFNIKNWEITEQDIKIINVLLTQDPQIQPESDNQNPIFQCLDLFGAFFEKSLAHDNLVKSLTTLGRVPDSAILMSTLCDIFVDILGYNERPIDATKRLGEQKTFSKLQSFAGFGDFVVSIAETKTNVPYTNTYKPIFQIYPYGLCIVVNPAHGWIRFVFSQSGQNTRKLNYRTFVGRRGRSVNDNLLTWIRRLHLIKPQFGDDHSKLRMRVEAAFSVNPSDLADRWDSRPFTSTEIPGFPWSDLCFNECRSFLQIDGGLSQFFRIAFPCRLEMEKSR